jgi:hypothetical protein
VAGLRPYQDAEKVTLLTRPTPARRDAPFPVRRFPFIEILNVPIEILGDRQCWRGFSVRQDPLYG